MQFEFQPGMSINITLIFFLEDNRTLLHLSKHGLVLFNKFAILIKVLHFLYFIKL